ncbi:MAG TPA: cell division protein ZipA C-terminal FtsZ-binding domain-containing protein [Casimicrobiaceae bacterium]
MTLPISNLQLGLIVAGVLLVLGVIVYNSWQERRVRRRIESAFRPSEEREPARVEPTLKSSADRENAPAARTVRAAPAAATATARAESSAESSFVPPMDVIRHEEAPAELPNGAGVATMHEPSHFAADTQYSGVQPDPDIESILTVELDGPVSAATLTAGFNAHLGKPLHWFGRRDTGAPWQMLAADTPGTFVEVIATMLLADRNGAASKQQLEAFQRLVLDIASPVPARVSGPDVESEVNRAESLDRLCADVDVQIGLTVVKPEPNAIPGTRLRGVAEASGFRLAAGGRFEYIHEDTGTVEYFLQNVRNDPFTADSLRLSSTPGVVFVLDVPRVADPVRTFDRMKLLAKRMATTLSAELVDDNRRALDDAALAGIRGQVEAAAVALKRVHIEPGSARALALFGA